MKRIEINLYPYKVKQDKRFLQLIEKYSATVFLGTIILISVNIILFITVALLHIPHRTLVKDWQYLSPKATIIDSLREEVEELREKKEGYQDLVKYEVEISRVLADIFSSLPRNVWLDKIAFSKNYINFIGYAVDWKTSHLEAIDRFVKKLKKERYFSTIFSQIRLKSSIKMEISGREVMRFEIECKS